MPCIDRVVERRVPILLLKIDVAVSCQELLRDGRMPFLCQDVEPRAPFLSLKIDITALSKELLYDGRKPSCGREVDRRVPILHLKIYVTASSQELLRDCIMPICGRVHQRCGSIRALVVDEGLRALFRQQLANLRCVAITRALEKLLPRHSFPALPVCFLSLFTCNLYGRSVSPTH